MGKDMEPRVEPMTFRDVVVALVANATDEARAGRCTAIGLEVGDDAVRVTDDGPGLPLQPHPRSGRPLLEVILTGPRRGPVNTLARVNASCLWLEVEVHKDGELWFQRHELALPGADLAKKGAAVRRGTTITCAPALGSAPPFEALRELVREATRPGPDGLAPRVKVRLRDLRVSRDETIVIA
jgi:DNA gyrase/topoisomerase IV subunit B